MIVDQAENPWRGNRGEGAMIGVALFVGKGAMKRQGGKISRERGTGVGL